MLSTLPEKQTPSDADVTAAFQRTQECRRESVSQAVEISHQQQSIFACETPLFAFISRVIPFLGAEGSFEKFADAALPARRLPMLPMPTRPRFEPYHDELPAKPLGGLVFSMVFAAGIFASLLFVAAKGTQKTFFGEPDFYTTIHQFGLIFLQLPAVAHPHPILYNLFTSFRFS